MAPGTGAFAEVYVGRNPDTWKPVAIKHILRIPKFCKSVSARAPRPAIIAGTFRNLVGGHTCPLPSAGRVPDSTCRTAPHPTMCQPPHTCA